MVFTCPKMTQISQVRKLHHFQGLLIDAQWLDFWNLSSSLLGNFDIFIVRWRVWMVTKMLIIVTKISLSEKNFFFILDEPSSRVTRIEIKVCTLFISVTDLTFHTTHKHKKIVGKFVAIMSSRGPFLKVPVNSGPKKLSVLRFFLVQNTRSTWIRISHNKNTGKMTQSGRVFYLKEYFCFLDLNF